MTKQLVNSTCEIYMRIKDEMRPRPSKAHYTFNLRDCSKVCGFLCEHVRGRAARRPAPRCSRPLQRGLGRLQTATQGEGRGFGGESFVFQIGAERFCAVPSSGGWGIDTGGGAGVRVGIWVPGRRRRRWARLTGPIAPQRGAACAVRKVGCFPSASQIAIYGGFSPFPGGVGPPAGSSGSPISVLPSTTLLPLETGTWCQGCFASGDGPSVVPLKWRESSVLVALQPLLVHRGIFVSV